MATKKKAAPKKAAKSENKLKAVKDEVNPEENGQVSTAGKTTDDLAKELEINKPKRIPGTVTIEKVKLGKKDSLVILLSTIEADGSTTKDSKTSGRPCHPDLKAALSSLSIHWAILNDYLSVRAVKDINDYDRELVETVHVSGISIGGNDGEEGLMILGHKFSRRKKAIIINTPFERFEEVSETRYKYMDDLESKIGILFKEVEQYLDGSKVGENPQQQMEFPEGDLIDEFKDEFDN